MRFKYSKWRLNQYYFITATFIVAGLFPIITSAVTLNFQVNSATDDAQERGPGSGAGVTSSRTWTGNGASVTTNTDLEPGKHSTNDGDTASVGVRFTNITVPQGTTITSATLTLVPTDTYSAPAPPIAFHVSAQDSDNAAAFSTTPGMLNATNRPRTTAECGVWDVSSTVSGEAVTRDVTACVQEVINRVGWVSGNAVAIIIDTHSSSTNTDWQIFWSYDTSPSDAAELEIIYSSEESSVAKTVVRGKVRIRGGAKFR